jgi:hypothetical protein
MMKQKGTGGLQSSVESQAESVMRDRHVTLNDVYINYYELTKKIAIWSSKFLTREFQRMRNREEVYCKIKQYYDGESIPDLRGYYQTLNYVSWKIGI